MASNDSSPPVAPDTATEPAAGKPPGTKSPGKKPPSNKPPSNKPPGKKPPRGPEAPAEAPGPTGSQKKKLKRVRKAGDLEKLKKKVWQTISSAEEILLDPDSDSATRLRAIHALVQASTAYTRLIDFTEHADRIAAYEKGLDWEE